MCINKIIEKEHDYTLDDEPGETHSKNFIIYKIANIKIYFKKFKNSFFHRRP